MTGLGTASAVSPGFRTATPASFTGHVRFDNFVDPTSPPEPANQPQSRAATISVLPRIDPAVALAVFPAAPVSRTGSFPVFVAATNGANGVAARDFTGVQTVRDSVPLPVGASGTVPGVAAAEVFVTLMKEWGEGMKAWSRLLGLGEPANLLRFLEHNSASGEPKTGIEDEVDAVSMTERPGLMSADADDRAAIDQSVAEDRAVE